MKIVHLCLSSFFIDGYSYQENLLPKHHALQGHDVTVIASTFSFGNDGRGTYVSPGEHIESGYKVIRIPYAGSALTEVWKTLRKYDGLYRLLEKESPNVIFSHGMQFWDARSVVKYIKSNKDVLLYADNHADYINSSKNILSKLVLHKLLWKYTAQLIAKYAVLCYGVTPMRCDFLVEMYGLKKDKVKFLQMGIDDVAIPKDLEIVRSEIRKQLGIGDKDFVISTGGKIDNKKNIHHLLSALRQLSDTRIHLIIFGTIVNEMKDTIDQFRNDNHVHFVGWCNAEQVMNYLVSSDLAAFPGTHSTLWEQSIGVGLPAIFKDWGKGFSHLYEGGNCVLVKGEDEEELTEVISSLVFTEKYELLKEKAEHTSVKFLYSDIAKRAITQR